MAKKNMLQSLPPTVEVEYRQCGMGDCPNQAMIALRKGNARMNVCTFHYKQLFQQHAHKWCQERGLDTREKMLAYCKRTARGLGVCL